MLEHFLRCGIFLLSILLLRSFFVLPLVLGIAGHERWRSGGINIRYAHLFKGRGFLLIPFSSKAKQSQGYMYMGNKASSNREAWS